ncbi:MAG: hypothetical protein ACLFTK_09350 [Anaerolineales bacterium]
MSFDKPIFKSKRFISAVVGVLVMLVVAFVPELQALESQLAEGVTAIVLALIAGYSVTDIALEWLRGRTSQD